MSSNDDCFGKLNCGCCLGRQDKYEIEDKQALLFQEDAEDEWPVPVRDCSGLNHSALSAREAFSWTSGYDDSWASLPRRPLGLPLGQLQMQGAVRAHANQSIACDNGDDKRLRPNRGHSGLSHSALLADEAFCWKSPSRRPLGEIQAQRTVRGQVGEPIVRGNDENKRPIPDKDRSSPTNGGHFVHEARAWTSPSHRPSRELQPQGEVKARAEEMAMRDNSAKSPVLPSSSRTPRTGGPCWVQLNTPMSVETVRAHREDSPFNGWGQMEPLRFEVDEIDNPGLLQIPLLTPESIITERDSPDENIALAHGRFGSMNSEADAAAGAAGHVSSKQIPPIPQCWGSSIIAI